MTIGPGTMLEHYRLVEKIGEGGMGVVWSAVDTTLDRTVAIKILPQRFAGEGERLARFEREAKLLASLNHPNIAAIYGLHATGETRFLAMELVPGEDLAAHVARGPLPTEEALRIAVQVASALEAAHDSGVIHRDLKPANVKLAPDGKVKVLDFGLAKAFSAEASADGAMLSHSPTITTAGTLAGVILGTAAYMSPEQAKGKGVDRRADVWAFGALLYEMLTGARLFEGETVSETLAAVIMRDIRWDALPATTPPRIRRLLRRCLQRDPRSRLRDAGDARLAIEETLAGADRDEAGASEGASAGSATASTRRWLVAAAALGGIAIGLAAGRLARPAPTVRSHAKFELRLDALDKARISPDGRRVVYATPGTLHVRDLDRLETREFDGTDGAIDPFWSPDGGSVGYGAEGKLFRVPVAGGRPAVVCELPDGNWSEAAGGAWLTDGSIVFTTGATGLLRVNDQGGDPAPYLEVTEEESDFHDASALPGGRGVLFVVHRKGAGGPGFDTIALVSEGKRKTLLTLEGQQLWDPVYSTTGHVLFHREPDNAGVWALPFALASLEVTGEPFLVASGAATPSVSADGTLVYRSGTDRQPLQIVRVDREGRVIEKIGEPETSRPFPALSPDGTRVAIPVDEHGKRDLWVHDTTRGTRSRLTFSGDVAMATWLPDNKRLVYAHGDGADARIAVIPADGAGDPEEIATGVLPSVSRDGKTLVFTVFSGGSPDLAYRSFDGDREPVTFLATSAIEVDPRLSPDGRYLAYVSTESGRGEIYIRSFPGGEGKWQVSTEGGFWPRFSARGDRLFFVEKDDLYEVEVARDPTLRLGRPHKLFTREPSGATMAFNWPTPFDVAADGASFVYVQGTGGQPVERSVTVVLNWFDEFRR